MEGTEIGEAVESVDFVIEPVQQLLADAVAGPGHVAKDLQMRRDDGVADILERP